MKIGQIKKIITCAIGFETIISQFWKRKSTTKKHLIELGTEISQMQDALAYLTKNIELTNVKEFQYQPYCVQSFLLQTYLKKFPDLQVSKAQFADLLTILNKNLTILN